MIMKKRYATAILCFTFGAGMIANEFMYEIDRVSTEIMSAISSSIYNSVHGENNGD